MSKLLRGLTRDGSAQILVLNSKEIVLKAQEYHHTAPTSSAALGRLLTATSLMGCTLKEKGNSLSVSFKGDGEGGNLVAVSDYMGNVRGCMSNPDADPERYKNGKLNVAKVVGKGQITVIKDVGEKIPYNGITEIKTGEIAEDIAGYYAESEQIPTLCALGVLIDTDGKCKAAGGVMVQLLPFAAEETIAKLEENASKLNNLSALFDKGLSNEEIANIALEGIEYDIFDEYDVGYVCTCSEERHAFGLLSLNPYELWNMLINDKKIETVCQFCGTKYTFDGDKIEKYRKIKEALAKKAEEENK